MQLKDRISSLEKQLSLEQENEFKNRCDQFSDKICQDAIKYVERAIKYKTYKMETKGFLWNKKTMKYVEDKTRPIDIFSHKTGPFPCFVSITDDTLWAVKDIQERTYFVDLIIKKLENEGFECWTSTDLYYKNAIVVYYKINWN